MRINWYPVVVYIIAKMSVSKDDEKQFSAKLKQAVGNGDVTSVRRIIKGGVDVNAKSKFWYGSTLLHEAISTGNTAIVKLLIEAKAHVNTSNEGGRTPLHLASRAGYADIVAELIKAGARVDARTNDNRTALLIAAWRGKTDVVRHLVEAGASVNCTDEDGWTSLFWAAKLGHVEMVKILVEHGAYLNTKVNSGQTPLLAALFRGHIQVMQFLVQAGADMNGSMQCKFGNGLVGLPHLLMRNKSLGHSTVMKLFDFCDIFGFSIGTNQFLRSEKIPEDYRNDETFQAWLRKKQQEVPPLACLCRNSIRNVISRHRYGKAVQHGIDKLKLPKLLSEYLLYTDELYDIT